MRLYAAIDAQYQVNFLVTEEIYQDRICVLERDALVLR
jgi:hypothetical protein